VLGVPRALHPCLLGLASDPVQQRFALNLFVAFLPAAIVGLAFPEADQAFLSTR
jgi:undecaprenyl-diphosphatase